MHVVLAKGKLVKLLKLSTEWSSDLKKVETGRLLNPQVYSVDYFGHKSHYDQNEKLGMNGAVHVCARDEYSCMITEFATIATKNCLTMHNQDFLWFCC